MRVKMRQFSGMFGFEMWELARSVLIFQIENNLPHITKITNIKGLQLLEESGLFSLTWDSNPWQTM